MELKANKAMADALKAEMARLAVAMQAETAKTRHIERILHLRYGEDEPQPIPHVPDPDKPAEHSLAALADAVSNALEGARVAHKKAMTATIMAGTPLPPAMPAGPGFGSASMPDIAGRKRSGSFHETATARAKSVSAQDMPHCAGPGTRTRSGSSGSALVVAAAVGGTDRQLADAIERSGKLGALLSEQAALLRREADDA
jgi:hypothetical protein